MLQQLFIGLVAFAGFTAFSQGSALADEAALIKQDLDFATRPAENFIEELNHRYSQVPSTRIVHGDPVSLSERPFQIALFRGGRFTCGGSLIGPRHVLTAAHCVHRHSPSEFRIHFGTAQFRNGASSRNVSRVTPHPGYDPRSVRDDIAVLQLDKPIMERSKTISFVGINRSVRKIPAEAKVTVSGWGRTARNQTVSEELLAAEMKIVDFERCRRAWSGTFRVARGMICAGDVDSGACNGDSGGPLTISDKSNRRRVREDSQTEDANPDFDQDADQDEEQDMDADGEDTDTEPLINLDDPKKSGWTQVGVVSVGASTCSAAKLPNIYTDVYYYRSWISGIVGSG